jgi:hypothetical protein
MTRKTAGIFEAYVRTEGFPTLIDIREVTGNMKMTLKVEELRDLKYVVDSALRIALENSSQGKESAK